MDKLNFNDFFANIPIPEILNQKILDENLNPITHLILTRINIFVGANNSGKSRLLRDLIRFPIKPIYYSDIQKDSLRQLIDKYKDEFLNNLPNLLPYGSSYSQYDDILLFFSGDLILNSNNISSIFNVDNFDFELEIFIKNLESEIPKLKRVNSISHKSKTHIIENHTINILIEVINKLISDLQIFIFNNYYERIYIPSARTLRTYAEKSNLKDLTQKDYNFSNSNSSQSDTKTYEGVKIENGQDFYETVLTNLTSGLVNRNKIFDFESFLKESFFEDLDVTLIPYSAHPQELHIKLGSEKEQPIFNLGDGLQMLIILTFPLFIYDFGIVVIEEPKLFIHPGLQKKFLSLLLNHERAKNFIFLIASHSNHMIDSIQENNDISIFTVNKHLDPKDPSNEKLSKTIISNVAQGNQSALSILGVTNSSVYLANCTIWVEGPTDRRYLAAFIQAFLDKCAKEDKSKYKDLKFYEGIHYSFVFSAGDTIIHWNFEDQPSNNQDKTQIIAKKLCGRAFVIVDEDNGKNIPRKSKLIAQLGMRFLTLPVVEIENLLSYDTIVEVIKSYPSWRDLDGQKLVKPTIKQISTIRLGSLIDKHILSMQTKKNRKRFAKISNGKSSNITIGNKVDFCNNAIKFINKDTLSPEAIQVVKKILDFIIEHNK